MKTFAAALVFASSLIVGGSIDGHSHHLCHGFLPENDMKIPVDAQRLNSGITEEDFQDVLDQIQEFYSPVVSDLGGTLQVNRLWQNDTVNASAQRWGSTYIINMYGGLARHAHITKDAFMLVACHEMGHHIGGAPKVQRRWNSWASNEGQSDYYGNLKCMRHLLKDDPDLINFPVENVDPVVVEKCQLAFHTQEEELLCMRTSVAGMHLALLLKEAWERKHNVTLPEPSYSTPDTNKVINTSDAHPIPQCRLDTYFEASLCVAELDQDVDQEDPLVGTCNRVSQIQPGVRPECWYKP